MSDWLQSDWLTQHESWLRRVLYARLGREEEVDDVLQEVALAVIRQAPAVAPAGSWLYRVAVRQALLHRRRQGRLRRRQRRYAEARSEAAEHDPLQWLLAAERRGEVRQALAELAPWEREILLLKHAERWSYRQLADNLGLSVGARSRARLFRARQRLRSRLAVRQISEVRS